MWSGDKVHVSSSLLCCNLLLFSRNKHVAINVIQINQNTMIHSKDNITTLRNCFVLSAVHSTRLIHYLLSLQTL